MSDDKNMRDAQLRYDAIEEPCRPFVVGECSVTHYYEGDKDGIEKIVYDFTRTSDGEMFLLGVTYITPDGDEILEPDTSLFEEWVLENERHLAEEAEPCS